MQDRYVGDIGDFEKYGLLRLISKEAGLRLGVNWYLVNPEKTSEAKNSDGSHIDYLFEPESYKRCDEELFGKLRSIVEPEKSGIERSCRKVGEIEKRGVLHSDTVFYNEVLNFSAGNRSQWVKNGIDALTGCDIVFFDPDNGFPPIKNSNFDYSVSKNRKKSVKYVYHDELVDYFKRGQSLIVYQHRTREKEEKYGWRFKKIAKDMRGASVFYIRFHLISGRDYVFILQPKHEREVKAAVENFLNDPDWSACGFFRESRIYTI